MISLEPSDRSQRLRDSFPLPYEQWLDAALVARDLGRSLYKDGLRGDELDARLALAWKAWCETEIPGWKPSTGARAEQELRALYVPACKQLLRTFALCRDLPFSVTPTLKDDAEFISSFKGWTARLFSCGNLAAAASFFDTVRGWEGFVHRDQQMQERRAA